MPVKFQCPKCQKRFVEWGAAKTDFKCPDCDGEELVRVGAGVDTPTNSLSLRRRPKKIDTRAALYDDDVEPTAFSDGFPEEDIDEDISDNDVEPEVAVGVGAADVVVDDVDVDGDVEDTDDVVEEDIPADLDFEGEPAGDLAGDDIDEEL